MIIDIYLFLAAVFFTLVGSRLFSLVVPTEFYFTFQSLFTDRPAQNMIVALISKMIGPLASGFCLGWFIYAYRLSRVSPKLAASGFQRRLRIQWCPTIFLGGFSAAFLSAWPIIVYWDLLANPAVTHLKLVFFVLYLLYMLAYGYIALLGFLGAIFVKESLQRVDRGAKLVSLPELSRVGALWILNSGIASAALAKITG
jgi:hypothetical protein